MQNYNQSQPGSPRFPAFSRVSSRLRVVSLSSHWLTSSVKNCSKAKYLNNLCTNSRATEGGISPCNVEGSPSKACKVQPRSQGLSSSLPLGREVEREKTKVSLSPQRKKRDPGNEVA